LIIHRDSIISMCYLSKPNPLLVTAGLDGQILLWNPVRLESCGYIHHNDKSILSKEKLLSTMTVAQKARCSMSSRLPVKDIKGIIIIIVIIVVIIVIIIIIIIIIIAIIIIITIITIIILS